MWAEASNGNLLVAVAQSPKGLQGYFDIDIACIVRVYPKVDEPNARPTTSLKKARIAAIRDLTFVDGIAC